MSNSRLAWLIALSLAGASFAQGPAKPSISRTWIDQPTKTLSSFKLAPLRGLEDQSLTPEQWSAKAKEFEAAWKKEPDRRDLRFKWAISLNALAMAKTHNSNTVAPARNALATTTGPLDWEEYRLLLRIDTRWYRHTSLLSAANRAIKQFPNDRKVRYMLGVLLKDSPNPADTLRGTTVFRNLVEDYPNILSYRFTWAGCWMNLYYETRNKEHSKKSIELFEDYLRRSENNQSEEEKGYRQAAKGHIEALKKGW